MKPDQDRVTILLRDTVLLLCRNGFNYHKNVKIQGLLGITLDDQEIFLVHLNEIVEKNLVDSEEDHRNTFPSVTLSKSTSKVSSQNTSFLKSSQHYDQSKQPQVSTSVTTQEFVPFKKKPPGRPPGKRNTFDKNTIRLMGGLITKNHQKPLIYSSLVNSNSVKNKNSYMNNKKIFLDSNNKLKNNDKNKVMDFAYSSFSLESEDVNSLEKNNNISVSEVIGTDKSLEESEELFIKNEIDKSDIQTPNNYDSYIPEKDLSLVDESTLSENSIKDISQMLQKSLDDQMSANYIRRKSLGYKLKSEYGKHRSLDNLLSTDYAKGKKFNDDKTFSDYDKIFRINKVIRNTKKRKRVKKEICEDLNANDQVIATRVNNINVMEDVFENKEFNFADNVSVEKFFNINDISLLNKSNSPGLSSKTFDDDWNFSKNMTSRFLTNSRGRRAPRAGEKLYICEHQDCGLSFYRSYTLYRHQRLKHGRRLGSCVGNIVEERDFYGFSYEDDDNKNNADKLDISINNNNNIINNSNNENDFLFNMQIAKGKKRKYEQEEFISDSNLNPLEGCYSNEPKNDLT